MALSHAALLELARKAARDASVAILDIYRSDFAVRRKEDRSPLTLADEQAEAIILAQLRAAAPDIPAIAEEEIAAMGVASGSAPARFWLIDPVDGTREFVNRNGEFTVNIGLIEHGRPVLGVVHVPVEGTTYAGCGPGTATRQHGDEAPVAIAARRAPAQGPIVAFSRSHAVRENIEQYLAKFDAPQRLVMGSSAKFCLVACGAADFYPRFGRTMEWDTGAGHAVLEAAGGSVKTLDGRPLAYGKPGFINPDFIASGNGA